MKTVNLTGYVLDEEGNIYGKNGKLLSQFTKDGRYLFVNLCNDGKFLVSSYLSSTTYLNRQFAI